LEGERIRGRIILIERRDKVFVVVVIVVIVVGFWPVEESSGRGVLRASWCHD